MGFGSQRCEETPWPHAQDPLCCALGQRCPWGLCLGTRRQRPGRRPGRGSRDRDTPCSSSVPGWGGGECPSKSSLCPHCPSLSCGPAPSGLPAGPRGPGVRTISGNPLLLRDVCYAPPFNCQWAEVSPPSLPGTPGWGTGREEEWWGQRVGGSTCGLGAKVGKRSWQGWVLAARVRRLGHGRYLCPA